MAGAMGQTALSLVGTKCSACDGERSTDSRTGKHCRTSNDDGGGSVDDNVKMDYSSLLFQTCKPECVTEVYNEYKGIGNYDGYPIIGGGLEAVEKKTNVEEELCICRSTTLLMGGTTSSSCGVCSCKW
jgi:hypothetical protein